MSVLGLVGDADTLIETTQFGSAIYATCPGAARRATKRLLPESARRTLLLRRVRHKALPLKLHKLGHNPFRLAKGERFNYEAGDSCVLC